VIVIQTASGRLWLPHAPEGKQHFTGVDDCQHFEKTRGHMSRGHAQAIKNYYRYIQHDRVDLAVSQVILAQIRSLRPDSLILPALRLPQEPRLNQPGGRPYLEDIYALNLARAQELKGHSGLEWGNRLICHMSKQNNQQLALDIDRWIKCGEFHLDLAKYPAFDPSDLDYYFP
jgi:hypothetical protein